MALKKWVVCSKPVVVNSYRTTQCPNEAKFVSLGDDFEGPVCGECCVKLERFRDIEPQDIEIYGKW